MHCVRFYVQEGMRHQGEPIHDWLFHLASQLGIPGGIAFRASAGFGRHGVHEDHFFELAGTLPEVIEFIGPEARARELIKQVGHGGAELIYTIYPVEMGLTGH